MNRLVRLLIKVLLVSTLLVVMLSGTVLADDSAGHMDPAPNSGDGIPDGSGFDAPNGPNADTGSGSGPAGPAPYSGDGIPDGSGFDAPNGPNCVIGS